MKPSSKHENIFIYIQEIVIISLSGKQVVLLSFVASMLLHPASGTPNKVCFELECLIPSYYSQSWASRKCTEGTVILSCKATPLSWKWGKC